MSTLLIVPLIFFPNSSNIFFQLCNLAENPGLAEVLTDVGRMVLGNNRMSKVIITRSEDPDPN